MGLLPFRSKQLFDLCISVWSDSGTVLLSDILYIPQFLLTACANFAGDLAMICTTHILLIAGDLAMICTTNILLMALCKSCRLLLVALALF